MEGTAIVTKTGLRVASSETTAIAADIYSASPATLIALGPKISELEEIIIHGTKGYTLILIGDADNPFMLFTNSKKESRLGYYSHKIKKGFKQMEPVLKQIIEDQD